MTELTTPPTNLDFPRAIVKVAVHLELVKSLRELGVTQPLELVTNIPRDAWRRWLQVRLLDGSGLSCTVLLTQFFRLSVDLAIGCLVPQPLVPLCTGL